MIHNDVLRSLRYSLNVSDAKLVEIIELANYLVTADEISAFLKNEDDPAYVECSDEVMAYFLNGLIVFKRGKDESRPPQPIEVPVTNNVVLKKVRVAFELKDTDILTYIERAGLSATKTELSAFFRNRDHRNFRECGDQFLRAVLKGIAN